MSALTDFISDVSEASTELTGAAVTVAQGIQTITSGATSIDSPSISDTPPALPPPPSTTVKTSRSFLDQIADSLVGAFGGDITEDNRNLAKGGVVIGTGIGLIALLRFLR